MKSFNPKLSLVCVFAVLAGSAGAARGSTLFYSNWDANGVGLRYTPWAGVLVADDITPVDTQRQLVHYDLTVFAPGGSTPYHVTSELYTNDGGLPGSPIAGTLCTHTVTVPDEVTLDCTVAPGVVLPELVWMVLEFDNDVAGWVVAEKAELGFTADAFAENDGLGWNLYWFEGDPYMGFAANLWYEQKPPPENLKWSQPPIEWDPNSEIPTFCGWDEPSWAELMEGVWWPCWNCRTQCYGDGNCDGQVTFSDLFLFWALLPGTYDDCLDFNRDGVVDDWDLQILQDNLGTSPFGDCPVRVFEAGADDFRCLGKMPVTSIHWWGSHIGWPDPEPPGGPDEPVAWKIGFWSNVEANPEVWPYHSYPYQLLWQVAVSAERVSRQWVGYDEFPGMPAPEACYQYYLELEQNEYFRQADYLDNTTDDVFWLSIAAIYPDDIVVEYPWGWKTRPWPWMDSAVIFRLYEAPGPGIVLDPYNIWPLEGFDMAFELDTDPNYIKWQQPFTGVRHWPHYEDEWSAASVQSNPVNKWWQDPDPCGWDVAFRTYDANELLELADDWRCDETGPIDDIRFWVSWESDNVGLIPAINVKIYSDDPCDPAIPGDYSEPNELNWERTFAPDEFDISWYDSCEQGYFDPVTGQWDWPNHVEYYQIHIDVPDNPFIQQQGNIYWLSIEIDAAYSWAGWKTSVNQWNDNAVYKDPWTGEWRELYDPMTAPTTSLDLAFALATNQEELFINRLVADDWPCEANTPITACSWWGSYLGYGYEACQDGPSMPLPVPPDYFMLTIWDDVPADDPCNTFGFSHPNEIIWQHEAYDYDEVLVGYDKYPLGDPNEAVFRYSVRLPYDNWFLQNEPNGVYWFSAVAVYAQSTPNYQWGWTNHEHVYNDDAVEGFPGVAGAPDGWDWYELLDQTGASADMSFILFTDPQGYTCWDPGQCAGQPAGDGTCDASINFADLIQLKQSFATSKGQPGYNCCADYDHNNTVNFGDLIILKMNFAGPGFTPSTGTQNCPP